MVAEVEEGEEEVVEEEEDGDQTWILIAFVVFRFPGRKRRGTYLRATKYSVKMSPEIAMD